MKTLSLLSLAGIAFTFSACSPLQPLSIGPSFTANTRLVNGVQYPVALPKLDANQQPVKNIYISPYAPHHEIDTKGFKSGELAGDPSTCQIDPKTNKPIRSTAKRFVIP